MRIYSTYIDTPLLSKYADKFVGGVQSIKFVTTYICMVAMSRKSRVAGTAFRFRRVTSSDSFGTVGRGILCATII